MLRALASKPLWPALAASAAALYASSTQETGLVSDLAAFTARHARCRSTNPTPDARNNPTHTMARCRGQQQTLLLAHLHWWPQSSGT
jgi:hypothetical protein